MSDLPYANVVGYSVTLAVYLLMASIAIPIYLMRRHQPVIQNRSIILSMISAFMGVIHFIALYVNEMDRTFVSCPFIIITSTFLPPLWGLVSFIISFYYYWLYFQPYVLFYFICWFRNAL